VTRTQLGSLLKAIANASHTEVRVLCKVLGNLEKIYTKMVCFLLNQYVCHPHFNKVLGTHVNNAELQISWSFQYVYWNNRL